MEKNRSRKSRGTVPLTLLVMHRKFEIIGADLAVLKYIQEEGPHLPQGFRYINFQLLGKVVITCEMTLFFTSYSAPICSDAATYRC